MAVPQNNLKFRQKLFFLQHSDANNWQSFLFGSRIYQSFTRFLQLLSFNQGHYDSGT